MKITKLILIIITILSIQVVNSQPCKNPTNTSGEITWTYIQYANGGIGYKILDSDLDSLETDTSTCFESSMLQKLIEGYNVGYDTVSLNNLQPVYYTIQIIATTVGGSTKDSIQANLLGKHYDETKFTVIDTFVTAKGNLLQNKFSITGTLGGGSAFRYPLWAVKLYGVNTLNATVKIYIWTVSADRPGGGGNPFEYGCILPPAKTKDKFNNKIFDLISNKN